MGRMNVLLHQPPRSLFSGLIDAKLRRYFQRAASDRCYTLPPVWATKEFADKLLTDRAGSSSDHSPKRRCTRHRSRRPGTSTPSACTCHVGISG